MAGATLESYVGASRARWCGFVGVLLCVIGSYGAGALSVHDPTKNWPVLGLLRHGAGPQVALTFVYVGVAVLLIAWLFLGRLIRYGEDEVSTRDLLITFIWWGTPLLISIPLFSRDLWSYAAQAHLTSQHLNPYKVGPDQIAGPYLDEVQRAWVDTPAPYGPLWLTAGRFIGLATGNHVYVTVLCMRLLSCIGVVLLAIYLPRLARAFGADPRLVVWLVLANPLLLMHFISGGHNDAVMLGLSVAGLALVAEKRRWWLGAILVTLGVAIKAPAMLVLAFCVPVYAAQLGPGARNWWRAVYRLGAVSLATFVVLTLASRLGLGWISHLNTAGGLISWVSVPTCIALIAGHFARMFGFGDVHRILIPNLRLAGEALAGLVTLLLWRRTYQASPAPRPLVARALGLAMTTLVLMGPIVQPWYLLWPLALLAVGPLSIRWQSVIAGVTVWASLLVTPQGATLFNHVIAVVAAAGAAIVGAVVVLGTHDPTEFGSWPGSRSTPLATTTKM